MDAFYNNCKQAEVPMSICLILHNIFCRFATEVLWVLFVPAIEEIAKELGQIPKNTLT